MMNLFANYYEYYYIVLVLQGLCVFHSFRRGTQQRWIWIIVFLPLVGSLVYIFTEVIQKRDVKSVTGNLGNVLNPGGRIKKLEERLSFSDTFANRMLLADAYLEAKMYDKAISLYEENLTSQINTSENSLKNLVQAYYKTGRYEDVVKTAPLVSNTMDFSKTPCNLYFALALVELNKSQEAEAQFKKMNQRFCNYEARYMYAMFLAAENRNEEALQVFQAIVTEGAHLGSRERSENSEWISGAQKQQKRLQAVV